MSKARRLGVFGGVLLAVFALLTVSVVTGVTATFDQRWADDCQHHAAEYGWCLVSLRYLTLFGEGMVLIPLGLAAVTILLWRRQVGLAVFWVAVALGGDLFNVSLKYTFARPRPPQSQRDTQTSVSNPSYPSGHTMAAMINFGLVGYGYVRWGRGRRRLIAMVLGVMILLVGLSRIYLRAHWVTDVLAGFAAGGAWLMLWIAVAEALRQRRGKLPGRMETLSVAVVREGVPP